MSRTTIDFGIDLGTTNSAIAVLRGTVPHIFKNNVDHDITPSAVFIDKKDGQTRVGFTARNRMEDEKSADDVYIEFKRRMGTDFKYRFKSTGKVLLPEDLSAEVLKSLRADVRRETETGEEIQSVVVTVPAAFELKQCAATKKAGDLAGFAQCALLQEPVAAALAYGFQADATKEYWLIYDFGGGTFDAAIMKADDGNITVVNHGGDNYLGGSDIDWAIIEKLVLPQISDAFNLPNFDRAHKDKEWKSAFAVLKRAVEEAKIQLSVSETAFLERCHFKDADGTDVDLELKLARADVISVAEPIIMQSVEICHRVLKEAKLSPSAIEKLILVGGPTKAPYFREILKDQLEITLDHSVDPLTVVALGAAVFAGTQRIEGRASPKAGAGQFNVKLKYKPVGADENPPIRGEVSSPSKTSLEGFSIEFVNTKTHWRSGKIALKADGHFKLSLLAEKGFQNVFSIELLDPQGRTQVTVPDSTTYTIGAVVSEQPLLNPIAVALANNDTEPFFKRGEPLPAKAMRPFKTAHAIKKGETGNVLNVPVVEGDLDLADRNRLCGKLVISGANIRRDLPAGSDIEVTLIMDTSRLIRVKAYIPLLDEEYETVIDFNRSSPDAKVLEKELEAEVQRRDSLQDQATNADDDSAQALLDGITNAEEVEKLVEAAQGDPDAANKAEKQLLDLKVKLDRIEDSLKWPALVTDINRVMDDLDKLVEAHGTADHEEQAAKLREQVEELIEQKRPEALRKKKDQVMELYREILFAQPGFWVGFFNDLIEKTDQMSDQDTADRLINQGRQCVDRGNVQGLRNVVVQMLGLLPHEVAEAVQRGYQSGLLK